MNRAIFLGLPWPVPADLAREFLVLEAPLADSDAWQLFEPEKKAKFRASTLAVFATVRQVVAG